MTSGWHQRRHSRQLGTTKYKAGRYTIAEGFQKAISQRDYWASKLEGKQKEVFLMKSKKIIEDSLKTANSGYDVAKGIHIEAIYYEVLGWTPEQYQNYLQSLD